MYGRYYIYYIYFIGYVWKISKNQAFFFSSCSGIIALVINKDLSKLSKLDD